jgi:hypothetical protein
MQVTRNCSNQTISLSQRTYIDSIVEEYGMTSSKNSSVPMDTHSRLSSSQSPQMPEEKAEMENIPYRGLVGKLMYVAVGTRVDIAFAVKILAGFVTNPGMVHWKVAKRVVSYLKGTRDWSLTYGLSPVEISGFVDADGNMQEDRRAVTGFVFVIDGGAVTWASRSQTLVSLSTCELEYVAATEAAKEGIWVCSLISQIFQPTFHIINNPTTLHSDNQAAIALARDRPISRTYQTHRHPFPLHLFRYRRREDEANLLSYRGHVGGHFDKGFAQCQGKAFCFGSRSRSELKGSVGIFYFFFGLIYILIYCLNSDSSPRVA